MTNPSLSMVDLEPDQLSAPFWDGIAQRELRLPRCSRCGRFQWYPDSAGPNCPGADYEWVAVTGTGTVHTMTRVHRWFLPGPGPGPDDTPPFVVGFIDLDDAPGVRLVAQLVDDPPIAIGSRVIASFDEVAGGRRLRFASVDVTCPPTTNERGPDVIQ